MKKLVFLLALIIPGILFAQAPRKTLLRAGKLFNSETGTFQADMAITVEGYTIVSVRPFKEVSDADKKQSDFIDLSNYTVLPGLIDAHTHILNKEEIMPDNKFAGLDMMRTLTMYGDAYRAIYGSVKAKAYLEAGITSVQDLGNSGKFADIALRKAIREGLISGPRMRCAGQGLSSEGGQLPDVIYPHREIVNDEYRIIKGPDDAVQAVRENITQGADVIKIYSNNTPNVTALSVEEMKAIVKEAHRYGVRVTAHATDNLAVYNAVISGVDGIEHGYQVEDSTFALMAKRHVVFIPTDGDSLTFAQFGKLYSPNDPNAGKQIQEYRKYLGTRLKRAIQKGVTIVAGSDDYIDFKMPLAVPSKRTLIGYYESGMSIAEVLKSATLHGARHLNFGDKAGILKSGYYADIIAVDNDLEKNINAIMNVHFVMKIGKVYVTPGGK